MVLDRSDILSLLFAPVTGGRNLDSIQHTSSPLAPLTPDCSVTPQLKRRDAQKGKSHQVNLNQLGYAHSGWIVVLVVVLRI